MASAATLSETEPRVVILGRMTAAWCEAEGLRCEGAAMEYNLARALVDAGFSGGCQLADAVSGVPRVNIADIVKTARVTVLEGKDVGFRIIKWRPFVPFVPGVLIG